MLIEYYSQQRSHQADLIAKIQNLQGLRRGRIVLVMSEGFVSTMIGDPLRQFCESHPEIALTLDVCSTTEVVRRVAEDEVDMGLVFTLLAPISVAQELASGELIAIPVDNRLLQSPEAPVVTRAGRQLSPAANRFLKRLTAQINAHNQYAGAV